MKLRIVMAVARFFEWWAPEYVKVVTVPARYTPTVSLTPPRDYATITIYPVIMG